MTVAFAGPEYNEDSGKVLLRMDGYTRNTAGASIDGKRRIGGRHPLQPHEQNDENLSTRN